VSLKPCRAWRRSIRERSRQRDAAWEAAHAID
jgi:hypothetical protein